jgi:organizing structure protein 2
MAARVFRPRALAPLAATVMMGSYVFAPRVAYAESPEDYRRKPIYDDPYTSPAPTPSTPANTLSYSETTTDSEDRKPRGPTPTDRLAVQISKARMFIYRQILCAENKLNSAMDSAFSLEHSFTGTIASLAPPRESGEHLMPGAVYVLVASMAGTIVARNRNILFRAVAPVALGIGAAWVVLPITTRNVADLAWSYEQRFPALADGHVQLRNSLERSWHLAKLHSQQGAQIVEDKVTETREAVEGWVRKGK